MQRDTPSYHGYRFPSPIISHAVWLDHRCGVSVRDVEDLLAQRGITVSYEAIRLWCLTFGSAYARRLTRRQGRLGDTWHVDEVFVTIQGQRRYLWCAVDHDGDVLEILVQSRRDCRAARHLFRKLLKSQECQPVRLVTDTLSSYRAAHRAVMPSVAHSTDRYANNRADVSHQPTRQREPGDVVRCPRRPGVPPGALRDRAFQTCQRGIRTPKQEVDSRPGDVRPEQGFPHGHQCAPRAAAWQSRRGVATRSAMWSRPGGGWR